MPEPSTSTTQRSASGSPVLVSNIVLVHCAPSQCSTQASSKNCSFLLPKRGTPMSRHTRVKHQCGSAASVADAKLGSSAYRVEGYFGKPTRASRQCRQ